MRGTTERREYPSSRIGHPLSVQGSEGGADHADSPRHHAEQESLRDAEYARDVPAHGRRADAGHPMDDGQRTAYHVHPRGRPRGGQPEGTRCDWHEHVGMPGTRSARMHAITAHLKALRGESLSYEMEWKGRTFQVRVDPLRNGEKNITGTIGILVDVTDHKQAVAELKARHRQQEAVANLGQRALEGVSLEGLLNEAVTLIGQTLDVEFCAV